MTEAALAEEQSQLDITMDEGQEEEQQQEAEQAEGAEQETVKPKPEEEQKAKKIEFAPEQQEHVNKLIGEKTGKFRQRERELEEQLEKERKERQALQEKLPKDQRPEVPELPNPRDHDFAEKIEARDKALKAQIEWDAAERARSESELKAQQDLIAEQNKKAVKTLQTFAKNADDLNISEDELRNSMQTLADNKCPDSAVMYLLDEPTGPQISKYLAQNPDQIEALQGLTPQQVAVKIATEIKPRAMESRPNKKPAPEPAETLKGTGAREGQRGPEGATYE